MKRILTLAASVAIIAMTAEAQAYRCEYGELVGGEEGVSAKCTVNSAGQITSVTPYIPASRQKVEIYRGGEVKQTPVQSYTATGKRAYHPTPLKPHGKQVSGGFDASNHRVVQTTPTYAPQQVEIISPSRNYSSQRVNIISADPTPSIQPAAYRAPCNFKIREVAIKQNANAYEVCYSDIESTDEQSMRKLYARVKRAARRACGTDYDSIFTRWSKENADCTDANLDRAVMASGIDPLRAYHLARTGKGTPTVYVGAPRDAY